MAYRVREVELHQRRKQFPELMRVLRGDPRRHGQSVKADVKQAGGRPAEHGAGARGFVPVHQADRHCSKQGNKQTDKQASSITRPLNLTAVLVPPLAACHLSKSIL